MIILGVDFGDRRTGLAVSDASCFLASGICTVTGDGKRAVARKIANIAQERKCELIVVGIPINMDGSHGPRAQKCHDFGELLAEYTALPVEYMDERCTTVEAHSFLNETNTRGKARKSVVDTLAAEIILQDYLDSGLWKNKS